MSEHLDEAGFYPHQVTDRLRYGDTDRQGHVNNAVFSTLLETGRVAILYDQAGSLAAEGCAFVIARLEIDFRAELNWPGEIVIGTAVAKIGRTSFELTQALFQGEACAARSRSVIVQMDQTTRRSHPLSDHARSVLSGLARDVA